MAERVEGRCVVGLRAEAAIDQYALIKYGTTGLVEAGASDEEVMGHAEADYAIGDAVSFTPLQRIGMHIAIANEAISIGDALYQAADGEVASSGTVQVGTAATACGTDGDWVSYIPRASRGSLGGTLVTVGTVAAAGSAQGDAGAITDTVTYVTAADGTKGVVLPTCSAGRLLYVYSTVATNGLKIYPATDDDINDGTTDAAITIEGKTMAVFVGMDAVTWGAQYTADS